MNVLLLGFGNVGKAFATLLSEKKDVDARVIAIVTASHGSLFNSDGISLPQAVSAYTKHQRFDSREPDWSSLDALTAVDRLDYDCLIELTTLSIDKRGEPAASHIRAALRRKKHAITANKGPIAFDYQELQALAEQSGCHLFFESTVMDGAPVFSLARTSLLGCTVTAISGILNSTTNFVLTQLERGRVLEEAVALAQREGFAEADPRLDLEGWDAAAKICVLWNVLGRGTLTPPDVTRQGILGVQTEDVARALSRSSRLKLVARAWREAGRDRATVAVEEVPFHDPFAAVSGTGSALKIETDCMSPILIVQENPSLRDTAYGVLNDLLTIVAG